MAASRGDDWLLAANTARGDDLARALLQGQLYFTGRAELTGLVVLAVAVAVVLPWLSHRLLLAQFFPEHLASNGVCDSGTTSRSTCSPRWRSPEQPP